MRHSTTPAALLLALLPVLLAAPATTAGDVDVRASLEPDVVAPGDPVFFSIEVRGGIFDRVRFEPDFELVNLEPVDSRPAEQQTVSWDTGSSSHGVRLTWRLRAKQEGLGAVQDIAVRVGGQRYELPAVTVRVSADAPSSQPSLPTAAQQPGRLPSRLPDVLEDLGRRFRERVEPPKIHLVAEATPRNPWTGQQITYTLWLYAQANVDRVNVKDMSDFRGFWVEELPVRSRSRSQRVELDGEIFWRAPVLQRALFARRPGLYTLEPAEVYLVVRQVSRDPFSRRLPNGREMVRASRSVELDVRPLPPVPADLEDRWSGLVGQMDLQARLVPSELSVGDSAIFELTLSGRGNVEGLATPEPAVPEGIRVLPPETTGGNRLEGDGVEAERTWRFPLVPERPDTWRLPPVEMAYFDPQAGRYRLASTPPLLLRARRGETVSAAGGPTLHPLKNAALPVEERRGWTGVLPWLFGLSWGLVLVTALVRWQREGSRQPDQPLERFLLRLEGEPEDGSRWRRERPRHVAIALEATWRDFLVERFDVPEGAPPSHWRDHLEEHGTPPRLGAELDRLVEDLQYLRHAPQLSTIANLTGDLRTRSARLGQRLAGR